MLTRRSALGALAAVPFLTDAAMPVPFQTAAGRATMLFGAAVRADHLFGDADFRTAVARQCGIITPELELKWAYLEPQEGHLDFTDADRLAAFAKSTGKEMHGHALLWHRSIAPWTRQALAGKPDWSIVRRFFASVIPRFGDAIGTWDVVNEPVGTGGDPDGLRPSPFLRAFGPSYVARAFYDARMFAPKARLFLNEFGVEYDLPEYNDKRRRLLALLEKLRKSGVPIDGLGIQAHLQLTKQSWFRERVLADFLNDVGSLGLEIRISELDVLEADPLQPVHDRDMQVADASRRFLDVALANRAVGSVTCWGLSDRYSWLSSWGSPAGLNRGLPLNSDLEPKPMAFAIEQAFAQRS